MPPKKSKQSKKELIIKSLKGFVKDEDGFVSKSTILKVGLSTVAGMAALGSGMSPADGAVPPDHTNHANSVEAPGTAGTSAGCCFQHTNTVTHSSY